jgi:thiosulfate/3-mercaptopyruvate sulfurtransferase
MRMDFAPLALSGSSASSDLPGSHCWTPDMTTGRASTSPVVDPQAGYHLVTEQLLSRLETPTVQVIDIRTDTERADDLGGNMPHGQIPGSVRLPWSDLLGETGRLIAASSLLALTNGLDLDRTRETVVYGSFGVDTALSWLALRNAGFEEVLSYDRGWAEWSTLPGLPREPLS